MVSHNSENRETRRDLENLESCHTQIYFRFDHIHRDTEICTNILISKDFHE